MGKDEYNTESELSRYHYRRGEQTSRFSLPALVTWLSFFLFLSAYICPYNHDLFSFNGINNIQRIDTFTWDRLGKKYLPYNLEP